MSHKTLLERFRGEASTSTAAHPGGGLEQVENKPEPIEIAEPDEPDPSPRHSREDLAEDIDILKKKYAMLVASLERKQRRYVWANQCLTCVKRLDDVVRKVHADLLAGRITMVGVTLTRKLPIKTRNRRVQTSPDRMQSSPDWMQTSPSWIQASPDRMQSSPESMQSSPDRVQSSPERGQTSPERVQTRPKWRQSSPERLRTRPEWGQTSPEWVQTRPKWRQSSPERVQTRPEREQTRQERVQIRSERGQTRPERVQTRPERGQTSPERVQTRTKWWQTSPERLRTRPEWGQTSPERVETRPKWRQTSPERLQTRPKWRQTSPERVQTRPKRVQTSTERVQTRPERVQTSPERVQTRPEWVQTSLKRVHTSPDRVHINSKRMHTNPKRVHTSPEQEQTSPERMRFIPELMQPIPERIQPITELMQPIPELMQPIPELMQPIPVRVEHDMERALIRDFCGGTNPSILEGGCQCNKCLVDHNADANASSSRPKPRHHLSRIYLNRAYALCQDKALTDLHHHVLAGDTKTPGSMYVDILAGLHNQGPCQVPCKLGVDVIWMNDHIPKQAETQTDLTGDDSVRDQGTQTNLAKTVGIQKGNGLVRVIAAHSSQYKYASTQIDLPEVPTIHRPVGRVLPTVIRTRF